MAPLEGFHVLDLTLLLPGPLCTQILRDMGARITKIEPPPPGDYAALSPPMAGNISAGYQALNRGKEITSLDLKSDEGLEQFYELAKTADVVVEGFRPGVIDRLKIGFDKLQELNPGIIVCSISGYGASGPLVARAGHDINYQALAGVLSISGGSGPSPPNPQLQIADTAAGSYAAAMLILAALLEREKTGHGRHIDCSMSEQLLPLMTTGYSAAGAWGRSPRRDGETLSGGAPSYHIFRTADGKFMTLGALEPKFWQGALEALGLMELADVSPVSSEDSAAAIGKLAEVFATKTRDQWAEIFANVDACCEPVLEFDEVKGHPQWVARQSFEGVTTQDGRTLEVPKMPASLARFDTSSNR